MPRIITEKDKDALYFVPWERGDEGAVLVRNVTGTERFTIDKECGDDKREAAIRFVCKAFVAWRGFRDRDGEELPCTPEVIRGLFEYAPEYGSTLITIARHGAYIGREMTLEEFNNPQKGE